MGVGKSLTLPVGQADKWLEFTAADTGVLPSLEPVLIGKHIYNRVSLTHLSVCNFRLALIFRFRFVHSLAPIGGYAALCSLLLVIIILVGCDRPWLATRSTWPRNLSPTSLRCLASPHTWYECAPPRPLACRC
jgi:hypothetical protein